MTPRRSIPLLATAALLIAASLNSSATDSAWASGSAAPGAPTPAGVPGTAGALTYPPARRGDQVDEYHGIKVADPYRWMEDIDSPETRAWVEAEAQLTGDYLAAIPGRDRIAQRLTEIWNYERWSAPEKHGSRWVFEHNDGLQNQSVLFTSADPSQAARVLLDPNSLSKDGTVAFKGADYSDDGGLMAYGLSEAGSDWEVWRVRDLVTGQDLPDEIHHLKVARASWRKDGSGFYYPGYDPAPEGESLKAQNKYQTLFFHRLGTQQAEDTAIYRRTDDEDWYIDGQVTEDGKYLIITANHGDDVKNTLLVQDLNVPGATVTPVIADPRASYSFIGNIGSVLYLQTDDDAPHYRVIAIDLAKPDRANWRTVIAESKDTLDVTTLVAHQLIAQYLENAHSAIRRYAPNGGRLGDVKLPGLGTAVGFAGHLEDTVTYYGYTDYTTPTSIFRFDFNTGRSELWRAPSLKGFDPAAYVTKQVFYTSKDGTRIPMFVMARKGIRLDGSNPTILYGYGGFNVSIRPEFSAGIAAWLEMGGVYAIANLRGGGEYGRAWHEAGMKTHKQHVFDDFIAAAEYLVAHHWTSGERLAIRGESNGGLLIGAVEEQRPDLFAAAVAHVGVMDMLRFREFTVGKGWESDFGSVDNEDEFKALRAYSPYHNVRHNVDYPPTLILTGDHDDRVFPAHSFKFAAAMQNADPQGKPILIRIDLRAGHGQGKPLSKRVEELADVYSFVLKSMGIARESPH
ncbi:MAG: prolyl oligopeptidase family serine peptidase [Steroidobacteraceae bacterium]|jgi:prolyl oligopeptidase